MSDEEVYDWLGTEGAKLDEGESNERDGSWGSSGTPIPFIRDGRPLNEVTYKLLRDIEPNWYEVQATWKFPSSGGGGGGGGGDNNPLEDDTTNAVLGYSLDLGLTSEHAQMALQTRQTWDADLGIAEDFGTYVNVIESEGAVKYEGYDRFVPTVNFTLTVRVPAGVFNNDVRKDLTDLIGFINSEEFMGYPEGSVMFSGANVSVTDTFAFGETSTFSPTVDTTIDLTFTYKRPTEGLNPDGFTVVGGIDYEGWELFWVHSRETITANRRNIAPTGAYACQIYPKDDLNKLIKFVSGGGIWPNPTP